MRRFAPAALSVVLLTAANAMAAERTVTLQVSNMDCAACPHIVRGSLQAVSGVKAVAVSFADKTARVTYDDAETDVAALTRATANAGYPSALMQ